MSLSEPATTPTQLVLRLAGLLAVLAGLFAMHGLTGQGAADMTMQAARPAVMAATSSMDVSELSAVPTGIVSRAGPLVGNQAEGLPELVTDSGDGSMLMGAMCLAILGSALLALLRFLHRPEEGPLLWSLPRRVRAIVPRGRDPDPPSLIRLSIQRC